MHNSKMPFQDYLISFCHPMVANIRVRQQQPGIECIWYMDPCLLGTIFLQLSAQSQCSYIIKIANIWSCYLKKYSARQELKVWYHTLFGCPLNTRFPLFTNRDLAYLPLVIFLAGQSFRVFTYNTIFTLHCSAHIFNIFQRLKRILLI